MSIFNPHGEASENYKLIIPFHDSAMCIIFTNSDSDIVNLSEITSEFYTITMFLVVNIKKIIQNLCFYDLSTHKIPHA